MKNWKKQLKTELDAIIPELSEKVLKEPIAMPETSVPVNSPKRVIGARFKQRLVTACVAIAILMVVAVSSIIIPLSNRGKGADGENGESIPAIVTIEINPKATFVLSNDGVVESVVAMNADADIILSSKSRIDNIKGKPIEVAVQTFVDYSARLGYVNLSGEDAIRLSSTGDMKDDWKTAISGELREYFADNNLKIAVLSESVNFNEFCLRTGLSNFDTAKEVSEWASTTPVLFGGRGVGEMTSEQLQQNYNDSVVKAVATGELAEKLNDLASDLITAQTVIGSAIICGDFTTVNLVRSEFNLKYGTKFKGLDDMLLFVQMATESLPSIISGLASVDTPEDFTQVLNTIKTSVGIDLTAFQTFGSAPATAEEFIKKQESAYNITFGKKSAKNKSEYEKNRDDFDYDAWLEGFVANNGFANKW